MLSATPSRLVRAGSESSLANSSLTAARTSWAAQLSDNGWLASARRRLLLAAGLVLAAGLLAPTLPAAIPDLPAASVSVNYLTGLRPSSLSSVLDADGPQFDFGPLLGPTITYPTSYEQFLAELTNRARANPAAEAARYAIDLNEGLAPKTFNTTPRQPVAIDLFLVTAAQGHCQWMIDNTLFQHAGPGGNSPGDRMANAGYVFTPPWTWGENLALYAEWPAPPAVTAATDTMHRNLFVDDDVASRGHRINILNGGFRDVGVGVRSGVWPSGGYNYQAVVCGEDFATSGPTVYLTGVAYADTDGDNFYTPGEGLAGLPVTAVRQSDSATFNTVTWSSGGYALALAAGTYTVTASGAALGGSVSYSNVAVGSQNVKRDFRPDKPLMVSALMAETWVYQNTPVTTAGRHSLVLSVTVVGDPRNNAHYAVAVTPSELSMGTVTVEATANPLVWTVRGGRYGLDPIGAAALDVTVTGVENGGLGRTLAGVTVRRLGDLDGLGGVNGQDKLLINKRLNGLVPDGREYDLDGLGGANGQDKLILNKILNGLAIP